MLEASSWLRDNTVPGDAVACVVKGVGLKPGGTVYLSQFRVAVKAPGFRRAQAHTLSRHSSPVCYCKQSE